MGTVIRPELSEKNKYWISKHRYYELKHFCLQYSEWKKALLAIEGLSISSPKIDGIPTATNSYGDPTSKYAITKAYYSDKIKMIERIAHETDKQLGGYILLAVTEELSFNHLKTKMDIPCGKDMYYDRYRRFFWLLNKER